MHLEAMERLGIRQSGSRLPEHYRKERRLWAGDMGPESV